MCQFLYKRAATTNASLVRCHAKTNDICDKTQRPVPNVPTAANTGTGRKDTVRKKKKRNSQKRRSRPALIQTQTLLPSPYEHKHKRLKLKCELEITMHIPMTPKRAAELSCDATFP